MTCGSQWAEELDNATCQFVDDPRHYYTYSIALSTGTTVTIDVESDEFPPYVFLYQGEADNPAASAHHPARLTYTVTQSDTYWILITTYDPSKIEGIFTLEINCTTNCQQPTIIGAPQTLSVPYGTQVRINLNADGTPQLRFRWFDEANATVTLANTYKMFITPGLQKSANFGVEVSNDCGSITRTAAIVTVDPCTEPSITRQPANSTVIAGSTATFSVTATGTDTVTFKWFEGARGDTQTYMASGPTLTVKNPVRNSSYWVRVTNACGAVDSQAAALTIGTLRRRAARH